MLRPYGGRCPLLTPGSRCLLWPPDRRGLLILRLDLLTIEIFDIPLSHWPNNKFELILLTICLKNSFIPRVGTLLSLLDFFDGLFDPRYARVKKTIKKTSKPLEIKKFPAQKLYLPPHY